MATVESLEKKLERIQAEAAETKKQLQAKKKQERARTAEQNRKNDTRRKVILGGFILEQIKRGDSQALAYLEACINTRTEQSEKRVYEGFGEAQRAVFAKAKQPENV